jgi:hypothetical protein
VVNRLLNLYSNHLTVVVVNGVQGRCLPNTGWSIRQGNLNLNWLERRLKGIPIYTKNLFTASSSTECYKVIAYVYDVKPTITSTEEFSLVDSGCALFEASSGCIFHRDP